MPSKPYRAPQAASFVAISTHNKVQMLIVFLSFFLGSSLPLPSIQFKFQPEYYKDATHFRSVIGNESEYRLEIPHAKLDYTGTYSVIATNCYGQAKAIISLQIYAKGKIYTHYANSGAARFIDGLNARASLIKF